MDELKNPIELTDNNNVNLKIGEDDLQQLCRIANRSINDLIEKEENLLIFPHDFADCKDSSENQFILSLSQKSEDGTCMLCTHNIAGFIGAGDLQISIRSRFANNGQEDYFMHYMLQKVLSINLFDLQHQTNRDEAFDFMLYLFPQMLNTALTQGLYKEYRTHEYNDANVRGVIDINRHIRKNIPFNGRVAYRTREYSHDNPVTQLVRHTIEYISHHEMGRNVLKSSQETKENARQIIEATPSYMRQQRQTVIKSNLRPVRHPYFTKYTALQRLCLQILRHEELKYGQGKDEIYGLLFDVAWLWEAYLATILTPMGFEHPDNKAGSGRIYLAENKFPRYPDFYCVEKQIVADAKYKHDIDERNDINQMITYMYRLKSKRGIFIMPKDDGSENECYRLLGYGKDCQATMEKYRCAIPQDAGSMKEFAKEMEEETEDKLRKEMENGSV